MQTIGYTDTDQIRSVLGTTDKEVSDADLTVRNLELELYFSFTGWLDDHSDLYTGGTESGATPEEIAVANAIMLYSTYFCAIAVVPALQLLARQSITDGKNALERFTPVNWQELLNRLQERLQFYRSLLETLTGLSSPGIVAPAQLTGVGLSVDPVTTARTL